jgi:tRNA-guanine transglycosylase
VRTLTPEDIRAVGSQVVLANTYHLYLEGRHEVIEKAGGLAKFMNWNGPTMTDSGGFQVFSMGFGSDHGVGKMVSYFPGAELSSDLTRAEQESPKNLKITEEGVRFRSPRDGSALELSPEISVAVQEKIGADMFFAFDECTSPLSSYEYTKNAVDRTTRWAKRCIDAKTRDDQAMFGVIQGGVWEDLRKQSTKEIAALPFEGFGLGGPPGSTKDEIKHVVTWMTEGLPEEKPRHLLGMGTPKEILHAIKSGVDLFDCVTPTREGRTGSIYTNRGRINIKASRFREDFSPLTEDCSCYACASFTKAYIHHLFRTGELLAKRLASFHNLFFINHLVARAREAIQTDSLEEMESEFLASYDQTPSD